MTVSALEHSSHQFCGFKIAGEEYAIPVMQVQEVIKPQMVTPIPQAQEQVRGLINLRGQIVTCLSLRKLFKQEDDLTKSYMNIIVKGDDGLYSLIVDEVTDIIDVDENNLESTPSTISENLKRFVDKIYKRDNGVVILLSIDELVKLNESEEV